jgi:hypothetical protein
MLVVSDRASKELQQVLANEKAGKSKLVIYFQGVG